MPTEAPAVPEAPQPTEVAFPPAPEFIEIGASIPLTGKFGSLGSQVKVGYDYAIADINAAGGVFVAEYGTKIPLRLTAYDDESDPTKAVSNLEKVFSEQNWWLTWVARPAVCTLPQPPSRKRTKCLTWVSPSRGGTFTRRVINTCSPRSPNHLTRLGMYSRLSMSSFQQIRDLGKLPFSRKKLTGAMNWAVSSNQRRTCRIRGCLLCRICTWHNRLLNPDSGSTGCRGRCPAWYAHHS